MTIHTPETMTPSYDLPWRLAYRLAGHYLRDLRVDRLELRHDHPDQHQSAVYAAYATILAAAAEIRKLPKWRVRGLAWLLGVK